VLAFIADTLTLVGVVIFFILVLKVVDLLKLEGGAGPKAEKRPQVRGGRRAR